METFIFIAARTSPTEWEDAAAARAEAAGGAGRAPSGVAVRGMRASPRAGVAGATRPPAPAHGASAAGRGVSSRYRGVHWSKSRSKWTAQIYDKDRKIHLGYYADELDAARAYDDAARRMRGNAAVVNLSALSARADSDSSDNEDD